MGKNTIGVFSSKNESKFFVFDIDSYSSKQQAMTVAWYIKQFLKKYFKEEEIHISFSGFKGYHVTLFFQDPVPIETLIKFYAIVLHQIQAQQFVDIVVEMRPDGLNKGIKLPMGINFRNFDDSNNYSYFCDSNFKPIENEVAYFMTIEKSSVDILNDILMRYENICTNDYSDDDASLDKRKKVKSESNNELFINYPKGKLKEIMENGLDNIGTRHNYSFLIAMYLKKIGLKEDEAFKWLVDWNRKQIINDKSKSSTFEVEKDVKAIIYKGVFSPDRNYNLFNKYNGIEIQEEDLDHLIRLNEHAKLTGKKVIYLQRILLALIIEGKKHSINGQQFEMSYVQITNFCGIKNRTSICNTITELEQLGCIDIVARNVKQSNTKNKSNIYKIVKTRECTSNGRSVKICFRNIRCTNCFYKTILQLIGETELNTIFTRGVISKIRKMNLDTTNCIDYNIDRRNEVAT